VTYERGLALGLVLEIALFSVIGWNFFTAGNAGEIVRASAEIGLLALALTPVILTGGIDLSVGSLLGLCAVLKLPLLLFGAYFLLRRRWRVVTGGAGAILGAILGGAKGALAGILIGGGGTIAATEGKDVDLPVGTVLRVRLDSPLSLQR